MEIIKFKGAYFLSKDNAIKYRITMSYKEQSAVVQTWSMRERTYKTHSQYEDIETALIATLILDSGISREDIMPGTVEYTRQHVKKLMAQLEREEETISC